MRNEGLRPFLRRVRGGEDAVDDETQARLEASVDGVEEAEEGADEGLPPTPLT